MTSECLVTASSGRIAVDLPWQESMPISWSRIRLKNVLREVDERTETATEPLLSLTRTRGLVRRAEVTDKPPSAKTLIGYKVCRPGDIVMNRMQAWSGMFGLASEVGLVSPDYAVLRLTAPADPRFVLHLLKSPGPVSHFAALSTGVGSGFNRLYTDQLGAVAIAMPPRDEQSRIAEGISRIDARTRRLIRAKQRLVALLNEQKQAIIQRAITRGVNPNVVLKPSGFDWLGAIPAHWKLRSLKQVADVRLSGVDKHTRSDEQPVLLCNYTDVYRHEFITGDIQFMAASATSSEVNEFELQDGDVLITKDSETWDDIAVPAVVSTDLPGVLCAYHLALVRPHTSVLGEYLLRAFQAPAIAHQFHVSATGVTRYGLSKHSIKSGIFPIPAVEEQEVIVAYIREQVEQLDKARERAQQEVKLIREYRARLIADVVTGRLDLRAAEMSDVEPANNGAGLEIAETRESTAEQETLDYVDH